MKSIIKHIIKIRHTWDIPAWNVLVKKCRIKHHLHCRCTWCVPLADILIEMNCRIDCRTKIRKLIDTPIRYKSIFINRTLFVICFNRIPQFIVAFSSESCIFDDGILFSISKRALSLYLCGRTRSCQNKKRSNLFSVPCYHRVHKFELLRKYGYFVLLVTLNHIIESWKSRKIPTSRSFQDKWLDTEFHSIVPEFHTQDFSIDS